MLLLIACQKSPTISVDTKEPIGHFSLIRTVITGPFPTKVVKYDTTEYYNYITFNFDNTFIDGKSYINLNLNYEFHFTYEFDGEILILTNEGIGELELNIFWIEDTLITKSVWSIGNDLINIYDYYQQINGIQQSTVANARSRTMNFAKVVGKR